MIRCTQCRSALEDWELIDGRCPFCFPRQMTRTRPLTEEEMRVVLSHGCSDCKGLSWSMAMGTAYCKACGNTPPTHVRFQ